VSGEGKWVSGRRGEMPYVASSMHVVAGGVWLDVLAAGQALRQEGGNALQSEVQRVARETTLNNSEGESCFVCGG